MGLASSITLDGGDATGDASEDSELPPSVSTLDSLLMGLLNTLTAFWLVSLVESLFVDSLVEGALPFMLVSLGFFRGVLPVSFVSDREHSLLFTLLFRISCCIAILLALGIRLLSKGSGPGSTGSK